MRNLTIGLFTSLFCLLSLTLLKAQTINIGPNQYAFRYTADPDFGLFFNATDKRYEFMDATAAPLFSVNAINGRVGIKTASPDHALDVAGNIGMDGSLRHNGDDNTFLKFTSDEIFLRAGGLDLLNIKEDANSFVKLGDGSDVDINLNDKVIIDGVSGELNMLSGKIAAGGGNSDQWNQAFSFGNHATAGYLTAETDPQVGTNTIDFVPRWNGSSLVSSNIFQNGNNVGIGTSSMIGASNFVVQSPNTGYGGMYVNVNGTGVGKPFYGFALNGSTHTWMYLDEADDAFKLYHNGIQMVVDADGDMGIGTAAPTARLHAEGRTTLTSPVIQSNVNYTGSSDVRAVSATSTPADGYGYGVYAQGGYRGVYGYGDGGAYTGTVVGTYGYASGTAGTRIGLYGYAYGGTRNYAVFASGDAKVSGQLFIGTSTTNEDDAAAYKLAVNGKIICEELRVKDSGSWPDYVFSDDYNLLSLEEVEASIEANSHLPGIPSASQIEKEGIPIGEMQKMLMQKIEEITLYMIDLKKENKALAGQLNEALGAK